MHLPTFLALALTSALQAHAACTNGTINGPGGKWTVACDQAVDPNQSSSFASYNTIATYRKCMRTCTKTAKAQSTAVDAISFAAPSDCVCWFLVSNTVYQAGSMVVYDQGFA